MTGLLLDKPALQNRTSRTGSCKPSWVWKIALATSDVYQLWVSIGQYLHMKAGLEVHISLSGLERGQLRLRTVKGRSWCTESEENINMQSVILLVVALHVASGAIHSWKAYYTGTTGLSEFPEFVALNLIDDQLMGYFDSNTNRFKSQFKWMEDNLGKEYDDRQTNTLQSWTATFKNSVRILMDRYNQTQGVHTWQLMYGCELNDDGTTQGYGQYGYDGADFVSLDKNTLTWTAANPQAVITKHKWEANRAIAEQYKVYLENECIEWLKKYVGYGKDTLERKVSPQVSLLQKDPSSPVTCHATGFYPSGVTITWQKNGQDHDEDVDLGELLPNEDGSFQRMSTLNVGPDEWKNNRFSCVVEHQDKTIRKTEDDIITNFDSVPIAIIVGAVAAVVLVIVIGVVGYLVYQRKKGFKPVSASDDGSNSSART